MTYKQRIELQSYQYKRMLEERRGHNYQYWNNDLQKKIDSGEWKLYKDKAFEGFGNEATKSETLANEIVINLRHEGYYARVICGVEKCVQRIKYFSVIYKPKGINQNT